MSPYDPLDEIRRSKTKRQGPTLFDFAEEPRAHARHTDPETSHEAAASISAGALRESQTFVLGLLREFGAMHDYAMIGRAEATGRKVTRSGLQTRRSELVEMGLVEDSGERVVLDTGRRAIVWRAVV